MTEHRYLQALVAAIALMFAAAGVAVGTGRGVADRLLRGLAVCAEIALILFLARPSYR
jgi:hypothetical protein